MLGKKRALGCVNPGSLWPRAANLHSLMSTLSPNSVQEVTLPRFPISDEMTFPILYNVTNIANSLEGGQDRLHSISAKAGKKALRSSVFGLRSSSFRLRNASFCYSVDGKPMREE